MKQFTRNQKHRHNYLFTIQYSSTSLTVLVVVNVQIIALFHYVMGIIEFANSDNNKIQLPPLNGHQD